jgi:hypothetical protein
MSGKLNQENMSLITDKIINVLHFCLDNKELWNNDKYAMIRKIREHFEDFYELYPRVCRQLVLADDITPLLGMITTFDKAQRGEISYQQVNDSITGALNATYIDGVLNSDKLVNERKEKQKNNT